MEQDTRQEYINGTAEDLLNNLKNAVLSSVVLAGIGFSHKEGRYMDQDEVRDAAEDMADMLIDSPMMRFFAYTEIDDGVLGVNDAHLHAVESVMLQYYAARAYERNDGQVLQHPSTENTSESHAYL